MKKFLAALMGSLCASVALSTVAAKAETLIMSTNVPPQHWASTQGAEPFMACVKDATAGRLDFNYFPSGQIAGFFESLNAVNNGLAQIAYIVVSAQTDKLALNGIPMLPELGNSVVEMTAANRKALDSGGLLSQEFANNRIRPLLINMFPPYQMISRTTAFDTLGSLQGKKITSGGGSLIVTLNALGANAIEMPAGDIYLAMQQGTVDGAMLALASVTPYKLQEVAKAMSSNGAFGSASGIWSIDTGVWEKLPPEHQKALTECGLKVEADIAKYADNLTVELKKTFTEAGVNVYEFSADAKKEIAAKLEAAREDYLARVESRGQPARQAYEEYLKILGR
jgi:TRAP-type transport system periplasmic protein